MIIRKIKKFLIFGWKNLPTDMFRRHATQRGVRTTHGIQRNSITAYARVQETEGCGLGSPDGSN